MKNFLSAKLAAGLLFASLLCGPLAKASPIMISGSISFLGNAVINTNSLATATKFVSFSSDTVNQVSGDYVTLPALSGDTVTFTPFTFYLGGGVMAGGYRFSSTPVASPLNTMPLWTFTSAGVTYSFMAQGTISVIQNSSFLDVSGTGYATITGGTTSYVPTEGEWTVQETATGSSFSFGATEGTIPVEAADHGNAAMLLALSLGGLAGALALQRKRAAA
jgi:hypothetical protein